MRDGWQVRYISCGQVETCSMTRLNGIKNREATREVENNFGRSRFLVRSGKCRGELFGPDGFVEVLQSSVLSGYKETYIE